MYLSVDRIACGVAVCEGENLDIKKIPLSKLPPGVREGSVIRVENGVYTLDVTEESRRRKTNFEMFKSLEKKDTFNT